MKGFYYIENSINEYNRDITLHLDTLEEAKEAMKYCSDWYVGRGTGKIYFQPTGYRLRQQEGTAITYDEKGNAVYGKRMYDVICGYPREFICRGCGLDDDGNVIWSDKEW